MAQVVIGTGAFVLMSCASAAPLQYSITDLGAGGLKEVTAYALNDAGAVVGTGLDGTSRRAFVYVNGAMSLLPDAGGIYSAIDINASGQITGHTAPGGAMAGRRGYVYANGVATQLGTLGGMTSGGAAISNTGTVVGNSRTGAGSVTHGFVYQDGVMHDIGTLGGNISYAFAINGSNVVTGSAQAGDGSYHAFLYENGTMQDLGAMGGHDSWGFGINDAGVVAGMITYELYDRAFRYVNGVAEDLGSIDGTSSAANAINNSGAIVGKSSVAPGKDAGVIWDGGEMINLNSRIAPASGWDILEAYDINGRGQIVAAACHSDGRCNSLLLSPTEVPEPSTTAALLAAMLGLFGVTRLRRNG